MDQIISIFKRIYNNIIEGFYMWYDENSQKSPQRILLDHSHIIIPFLMVLYCIIYL